MSNFERKTLTGETNQSFTFKIQYFNWLRVSCKTEPRVLIHSIFSMRSVLSDIITVKIVSTFFVYRRLNFIAGLPLC